MQNRARHLQCLAALLLINACNGQPPNECTAETLEEFTIVCDVEATHDLLTFASFFLKDDVAAVELWIVDGDLNEITVAPLPLEFLRKWEKVGSYTDKDGIKIFIWRYTIPAPSCEVVEEFCGSELCPDRQVEFDFSRSDGLIYYIVFLEDVCTLERHP